MLTRIIEWSIDNRFLVVVGTLALVAVGLYTLTLTPLDAIPDLSDVQVILYTEYPGQAPRIVEDQVTYPLTTAMLAVPHAKVVRGYSFFGFSFVYVIFDDGTDMYWARSRVLEYLSSVSGRLPRGVAPSLGPDATGVGWALMYALKSDRHDLAELRSIQDYYLEYELSSVAGVSEVAPVGGFVKQYQVTLDPTRLRGYDISITKIRDAIERSNRDVGGRVLEAGEKELMIRGLGYIRSLDDIRDIALGVDHSGAPILLGDVARVAVGPEMRRGLVDWDGLGEVVGGIVVVRSGADTLSTIREVKAKLADLQAGLPEGVVVEIAYDRTGLIERSIDSLKGALSQQFVIVGLVCMVFLFHIRSGLVAMLMLPVAILMAFIALYLQGLTVNIMSLGGIAVAIGTMVDAGIVMVENAHKHLAEKRGTVPHWKIIAESSAEVGPSLFFSLLVITVSFIPVFTLEAQEGRLFRPLAFTKTWSMAAASLLALTLVPVLVGYFVRGKVRSEQRNPVNRLLVAIYEPVLRFCVRFRWPAILAATLALALTWIPYRDLGEEFMPPLWEGDLLYMPTTLPGISVSKAREVVQQTDKVLMTFPEVDHVFGKIGRAETATDPAPLSMVETVIRLKPESEWRPGMSVDKLIAEMNAALQIPGLTNSWTMPIKTRIDMLSTGIKTPVGVKIAGPDLPTLEQIGKQVESVIREVPGTSSVYAERVMGGSYLDFRLNRREIARFGLTAGDVQEVIQAAIGGVNVTTTVEGLERYSVNLRYARELRDDIPGLQAVLAPTPAGPQIPLGRLAEIRYEIGPPAIKSEAAKPNAWVYVDIQDDDIGAYVERARQAVADNVELPPGYSLAWSGQYEYMERAEKRLAFIVPVTLLLIVVILYLNTRSAAETLLVMLGAPFAVTGAVWLLHALDYNLSIAVWVGIIALAGLYAETAIVLLLYLDGAYHEAAVRGRMESTADLWRAVRNGAAQRIRPILMTIATDVIGLAPILWSAGAGSDVMKRIATPLVGGIATSGITVLLLLPAAYTIWRGWSLPETTMETS